MYNTCLLDAICLVIHCNVSKYALRKSHSDCVNVIFQVYYFVNKCSCILSIEHIYKNPKPVTTK